MSTVGSPLDIQAEVIKNNMNAEKQPSPILIKDVVMAQLNRPEVQLEALQLLRSQRSPLNSAALHVLGLVKHDEQQQAKKAGVNKPSP